MSISNKDDCFSLNPEPVIQILSVGHEQNPVIVVDELLNSPQQLLEYADQGVEFQSTPTDYYPGIRKPIEGNYSQLLCTLIQKSFQDRFGLKNNTKGKIGLCALSLATTKQEQLKPIQCLPHFDTSNPFQLAVIHYLCSSVHGGTSFYRHRKTGYESINPHQMQYYATTLKNEVVEAQFPGKQYLVNDNQWFERIARIEAKFNRAIFFQGQLLHSGDINPEKDLSSNPKTGRLTATTFIDFVVNNHLG